ncbi:GNAT family N-acetyltransferase [Seonamhaeicola sp.]|uniref:GNAT family N-acetyltransferase n=1 Tax=Seonamhaeicola sp. TaxID=1912245 RepID=UPI00260F9D21|nr:GNAT family N-acetyltransferase [Seonamhaeicola sp.]
MKNRLLLENEETKRLRFRKVQWSDFDAWLKFHENPETSKYWEAALEAPEIECQKWYDKQFYRYNNNLGGMNALIEKDSENLIGHCGLLVQTVDQIREIEIGYSLLPEFWNKGYATEAAKKCRDYAFSNHLTDSIISIISLTNKPSENVALKNGMSLEKRTIYNGNEVNIFRIKKTDWLPE